MEDKDISAQIGGNTDNDTYNIIDTNFTQWNDNTNCQPSVPVVRRFTGVLSELQQTQPPHINKDPSPLVVLIERQGRQAASVSQLRRLATRQQTLACAL